MTSVLLLGAMMGLGLSLVVNGLRHRPLPLGTLLAQTRRTGRSVADRRAERVVLSWWSDVVRERAVGVAERLHANLAVVGRTPERHLVEKLTTAVALGAMPLVLGLAGPLAHGSARAVAVIASVAGVFGGYRLPDVVLARQAAERRTEFSHALSSYLDLVTVLLAGGAGVETALEAAVEAGDGWAFDALRAALVRARTARRSPWDVFGELGHQLGIDALIELAASLRLAGEHGARVRSSLAARAAALRSRQLAQVEALAQSASERMGVPTVVLFIAFLALIGYPQSPTSPGPDDPPTAQLVNPQGKGHTMSTYRQILQYTRLRAELARAEDRERGEVSTTTIIWAAALVLVAVAVSAALVQKISDKSDEISF